MLQQFSRTELLLGADALKKLAQSRIAIFGLGGVGGYAAEALARSGIGHFLLIDNDTVALTNLNRQIIALHSNLGRYKVDVMSERILDINPNATVEVKRCFFTPAMTDEINFSQFDYLVDAVDTVSAKIALVLAAKEASVPIVSCMGAGNKLNPSLFRIADIYSTNVCPLARVLRKELKQLGIKQLKVVYSPEPPAQASPESQSASGQKFLGSTAYCPAVAGLLLAAAVVKDLTTRK